MNGIPDITCEEDNEENKNSDDENLTNNGEKEYKPRALCAPYIQIFKNG